MLFQTDAILQDQNASGAVVDGRCDFQLRVARVDVEHHQGDVARAAGADANGHHAGTHQRKDGPHNHAKDVSGTDSLFGS